MSLAGDQGHLPKVNTSDPPENGTNDEAHSFHNHRELPSTEISPRPTAGLLPNGISTPHIESYSADTFTAMTFCFPGFEDDMANMFEDCVQDTE